VSFLDDFLIRAALAGIGVALAAGPIGCFVVWRRMAYFGDAASHAAILGVALALAVNVPVFGGVLIAASAMAAGVAKLAGKSWAMDTLLGVAAHAALAFGLVADAAMRVAIRDLRNAARCDRWSLSDRTLLRLRQQALGEELADLQLRENTPRRSLRLVASGR
jgi:ABC-type Mn2+/Zn2+ transport system permease subunit